MSLKQTLDADLKQAMLSGDKVLVTTLRGVKSAILYVEVAKGAREEGLPEAEVVSILSKEAKKRQESADMYIQGGNQEKANAELTEKKVIEKYLPQQLSEAEISALVDEAVNQSEATGPSAMGQIIGIVKTKTAGQADGSLIARLVKERLAQ